MSEDHYKNVYDQYWNHARHNETLRLYFTSIYAFIVSGTLAYFGSTNFDGIFGSAFLLFLIAYSFLGYLIVYNSAVPFVIFTRKAEAIAICEWNLPEYYCRFSYSNDSKSRQNKRKFGIQINSPRVFVLFYSLALSVFISCLLQNLGIIFNLYIQIFVITSILVLIYIAYFERDMRNIHKEFLEKINSCRAQKNKDNDKDI